jgi:hypothetical protein
MHEDPVMEAAVLEDRRVASTKAWRISFRSALRPGEQPLLVMREPRSIVAVSEPIDAEVTPLGDSDDSRSLQILWVPPREVRLEAGGVAIHDQADRAGRRDHRGLRIAIAVQHAERDGLIPRLLRGGPHRAGARSGVGRGTFSRPSRRSRRASVYPRDLVRSPRRHLFGRRTARRYA